MRRRKRSAGASHRCQIRSLFSITSVVIDESSFEFQNASMPSLAALALVVHVTNLAGVPPSVLRDAQVEVASLFRDIDIAIEWQDDTPRDGEHVEARLILLPREEGALRDSFVTVLGAASRTQAGT